MQKAQEKAKLAKESSYRLASMNSRKKDEALDRIAVQIERNQTKILEANQKDLKQAKLHAIAKPVYDRLSLNASKLHTIIQSIQEVASLPDPIGQVLFTKELDHGLVLRKMTVPIGVVGVIFESRPDALVQIATLCIKSANAALLKGGAEAYHTNRLFFEILTQALQDTEQAYAQTLQWIDDRQEVGGLLSLDQYIDLIIPRGSRALVEQIKSNTNIPVLGHTEGICHLYVDREADISMAVGLFFDAKCQYPAACNAIETLLVHRDIANRFLPALQSEPNELVWIGDETTARIIRVKPATQRDWVSEYSNLVISIRVVESLTEAVEHINRYSSHHTDAIVTADVDRAELFMRGVDSSSTMWNCSTRFADGYRYGFGAEIGISTNKIHARGPVGLEGLTSYKYLLTGQGHIVADYLTGKSTFFHENHRQ